MRRDVASSGYRLPPILQDPPADGTVENLKVAPTSIAQCDRIVSPQCIRAMYNVTYPTTAADGNQLGIFEDLGDIYDQPDLNLFFQTLTNITGAGRKPVDKPIDGAPTGTTQDNAGVESLLDLSIAMPLIYPQKVWLYQTDDLAYENNYTYQGFLNNFVCSLIQPTNTALSISNILTHHSLTQLMVPTARSRHSVRLATPLLTLHTLTT